jgi:hypothetical protein
VSTTFRVAQGLGRAHRLPALLAAQGAVAGGLPEPGEPWETGRVAWIWMPGRSTRAAELVGQEGDLLVRLLALTSEETGMLAVAVAAAVAGPQGTVGTSAGPLPTVRFAAEHGADWQRRRLDQELQTLEGLVREGSTVAVSGPHRDAWLGPWVVAQLADLPPAERWPALAQRLRAVQYPESPTLAPTALALGPAGGVLAAELVPGRPVLLPPVHLVALLGDQQRHAPLAAVRAALEALGRPATRLDERQWLVAPLDGEQWAALVAALAGDWVAEPLRWRPPSTGAPAEAGPTGPLVPVLRPAGWAHAATQLSRPLATGAPGLPLVSWAVDRETTLMSVPADPRSALGRTPAEVALAAEATLEGLDPEWAALPDPMGIRDEDGVVSRMEHAAALLCCPSQLRAVQAELGATQLLVCAPFRELVMVQDAWLEPVMARTARLLERAAELAERARQAEHPFLIGAQVFLVDDGAVVGLMRPTGVVELGPPPSWPPLPPPPVAQPTPPQTTPPQTAPSPPARDGRASIPRLLAGVLAGVALLWGVVWLAGRVLGS